MRGPELQKEPESGSKFVGGDEPNEEKPDQSSAKRCSDSKAAVKVSVGI
jgi:hypothetical protein